LYLCWEEAAQVFGISNKEEGKGGDKEKIPSQGDRKGEEEVGYT